MQVIAAAFGVSLDELLASREDHFTYTPGMCITCESVYEDVHFQRAEFCTGCETHTVWCWQRIESGDAPTSNVVRRRAFRVAPRLGVLSGGMRGGR